jgi:hypothetical protein
LLDLGVEQLAGPPTQYGCTPASAPSIAAAPLSPGAGTGRPRRGASRHGSHLVSSCAHPAWTVVPYSQRGHPMCHRCATPWPSLFPVREISRHSNCEPACAVSCTGRTRPVGIVQHVGSQIARVRVTRAAGGGPLASFSRRRRRPGGGFWHVVLDATYRAELRFYFNAAVTGTMFRPCDDAARAQAHRHEPGRPL